MKLVKSPKHSVLFRTIEFTNRYFLSIATLGVFDLDWDPVAGLGAERDLWELFFQEMGEGVALDELSPKPHGEVIVAGKCCAPRGRTITGANVSLRVGAGENGPWLVDKTLQVSGDRHWIKTGGLGRSVSEPEPFAEMPITWDNTFGGKKFKLNPLGKGAEEVEGPGGTRIRPVPNIQDPKRPMLAPDEEPKPCSFAPIPFDWERRMKKAGTYNDDWKANYAPGYPGDMDWTMFNQADDDQGVEGFLRGGEYFELTNMNPDHPVIRGRLPELRFRCFLKHRESKELDSPQVYSEVTMRLDTVWFLPGVKKGFLVYRGLHEVYEQNSEDVTALLIGHEGMGDEPKAVEHYHDTIEKNLKHDINAAIEPMKEWKLIAEGERGVIDSLKEEHEKQLGVGSPLLDNINARAEEERAQGAERAIQEMEKARAENPEFADRLVMDMFTPEEYARVLRDPAALEDVKAHMPPERLAKVEEARSQASVVETDEALPDFSKLAERLEAKEDVDLQAEIDQLEAYQKDLRQKADEFAKEKKAEAEAKMREACEEAGLDYDEEMEKLNTQKAAMPQLLLEQITAQFESMRAESPEILQATLEAMGSTEAEVREKLTEADEQALVGYRMSMEHYSAPDPLPDEVNQGRRSDLAAHLAAGDVPRDMDLLGADLRGMDFQGATLRRVYLVGANLEGVSFRDCDLTGSVLAFANCKGCDFTGATMARAGLSKGDFREATFQGADLTEAILSKGNFQGAVLDQATLVKCKGEGIDFRGASLRAVNLGESILQKAIFSDANLEEANLRGAIFDECSFDGVSLRRANVGIERALAMPLEDGESCYLVFQKCDFSNADFRDCKLYFMTPGECLWTGANFAGANLSSMTLGKCDLRGARLPGAIINMATIAEADAEGVDFSGASFDKTLFNEIRADRANFEGLTASIWFSGKHSTFKEANFRGANIFRCNLGETDFRHADFEGASMRECAAMESDFREARLRKVNAFRTTFKSSNLEKADMAGIFLREGSLQQARVVEADLRGANLSSVNFMKAIFGKTNLDDACLNMTILKDYKPE